MRQAKFTRRRTWPQCAATFSPVTCLTSGRGRHCGTRGRSTASVEPHGAVAWQGFLDWLAVEPLDGAPAVLLETAHPAKFPEEIEKNLGFAPDVPPALIAAEKLPEDYDCMEPDYEKFRSYLIQRHAAA